jgi:Domain of unknown function (DUF5664)
MANWEPCMNDLECTRASGHEPPCVHTHTAGSQTDPVKCLRYDGGKERLDLIPSGALFELARVYARGAEKYKEWNWVKGTSFRRVFAALLRHSYKWARGESIDPETGCHHLAHAAFWCFALMTWEKSHAGEDDRVNPEEIIQ